MVEKPVQSEFTIPQTTNDLPVAEPPSPLPLSLSKTLLTEVTSGPDDLVIVTLIMYGLYVGCLGPIVTIAAYLIIGKPIFQREKPGARHGVMKTVADAREDLMLNEKHEIYTLLNAFGKWSNHSNPSIFSKENRLVNTTFKEIQKLRTDVYKKLEERRIIDGSDEMWGH